MKLMQIPTVVPDLNLHEFCSVMAAVVVVLRERPVDEMEARYLAAARRKLTDAYVRMRALRSYDLELQLTTPEWRATLGAMRVIEEEEKTLGRVDLDLASAIEKLTASDYRPPERTLTAKV